MLLSIYLLFALLAFLLLCHIHFVSLFFGLASSVEIPEAESLLHADCNEQEVICELSRYITRGAKPDSVPAHFIASVQLEGGGVGFTLVLQTIANENAESNTGSLMQSKLQLPLSQWGTLITEGYYSVKLLLFLELCAYQQAQKFDSGNSNSVVAHALSLSLDFPQFALNHTK